MRLKLKYPTLAIWLKEQIIMLRATRLLVKYPTLMQKYRKKYFYYF